MASSDDREEALYSYHRKAPRTATRSSSSSSLKNSKHVTRKTTTITTTTTVSTHPEGSTSNTGIGLTTSSSSPLFHASQRPNGTPLSGSSAAPVEGGAIHADSVEASSPGIGFSPVVYPRLSVPLSIDTRNSLDLRSSTVLTQSPMKSSQLKDNRDGGSSDAVHRQLVGGDGAYGDDSTEEERRSRKNLVMETSDRYRDEKLVSRRSKCSRSNVTPSFSSEEEKDTEDSAPEAKGGRRSSTLEPSGPVHRTSGRSRDPQHSGSPLYDEGSKDASHDSNSLRYLSRTNDRVHRSMDDSDSSTEGDEENQGNHSDTMRPDSGPPGRQYEKTTFRKTHRSTQQKRNTTSTTTAVSTTTPTNAAASHPITTLVPPGTASQANHAALSVIPAAADLASTYALPPHFVMPMQPSLSPSQSDSYAGGGGGGGPLGMSYHSDIGSFSTGFNGSRAVRPPSSYTPERKSRRTPCQGGSSKPRSTHRSGTAEQKNRDTKASKEAAASRPSSCSHRAVTSSSHHHHHHNHSRLYKVPPTSRRTRSSPETGHSTSSMRAQLRACGKKAASRSHCDPRLDQPPRHRSPQRRHTDSTEEEEPVLQSGSTSSSCLWNSGSPESTPSRITEGNRRWNDFMEHRREITLQKLFHRWSSRTLARMVDSSSPCKKHGKRTSSKKTVAVDAASTAGAEGVAARVRETEMNIVKANDDAPLVNGLPEKSELPVATQPPPPSSPAVHYYYTSSPSPAAERESHPQISLDKRVEKKGKKRHKIHHRKKSSKHRRRHSSSSSSSSSSISRDEEQMVSSSEENSSGTMNESSSPSSSSSHHLRGVRRITKKHMRKRSGTHSGHSRKITPSQNRRHHSRQDSKTKMERKRRSSCPSSTSSSLAKLEKSKKGGDKAVSVAKRRGRSSSSSGSSSRVKPASQDRVGSGGREVKWSSPLKLSTSSPVPQNHDERMAHHGRRSACRHDSALDFLWKNGKAPHCLEQRSEVPFHRQKVQVPCAYCSTVKTHLLGGDDDPEEEGAEWNAEEQTYRSKVSDHLSSARQGRPQGKYSVKRGREYGQIASRREVAPSSSASASSKTNVSSMTTSASDSALETQRSSGVSQRLLNDPHIAMLLRQLSPNSEKRIRDIFEGTSSERRHLKKRTTEITEVAETGKRQKRTTHHTEPKRLVGVTGKVPKTDSTGSESCTSVTKSSSSTTICSSEDRAPRSLGDTLKATHSALHSDPSEGKKEGAHRFANERAQHQQRYPRLGSRGHPKTHSSERAKKTPSKQVVPFFHKHSSHHLTNIKRSHSSSKKRQSRTPFCHRHLFPETFKALEKLVQVARDQQRLRQHEEEPAATRMECERKEAASDEEKQRGMEERKVDAVTMGSLNPNAGNTIHEIEKEIHHILEKHARHLTAPDTAALMRNHAPEIIKPASDEPTVEATAFAPHHVHFYSSPPLAVMPCNFLYGIPSPAMNKTAAASAAATAPPPHAVSGPPPSPLPSLQGHEELLRAAAREGSGRGSTPPMVRLTSIAPADTETTTATHQGNTENQVRECPNERRNERDRHAAVVPPLQMEHLSLLQEGDEANSRVPTGKRLVEETLPPTSDLLPHPLKSQPLPIMGNRDEMEKRDGMEERRCEGGSFEVGVQWASPRDQGTQHNESVLWSSSSQTAGGRQSSEPRPGVNDASVAPPPSFSVNIVYPDAEEGDVKQEPISSSQPSHYSTNHRDEASNERSASMREDHARISGTASGQQTIASSHRSRVQKSSVKDQSEGQDQDSNPHGATDPHRPKETASVSCSSSSPTATTSTDIGQSFFAGVPGMFYVCDNQGRFIPVADPVRAELPLSPDGSQLRDPLYYVAGDSGAVSSQASRPSSSPYLHPPQRCPWSTYPSGRYISGSQGRRSASRQRTTSPGKGGLSWSSPPLPPPGATRRGMRHGPISAQDAPSLSSASNARGHRHVSPYTSRLRQFSPKPNSQPGDEAGADVVPPSGGPLGCSRLNPYCQVCRDRFRLVFVDENMQPVPVFTETTKSPVVGSGDEKGYTKAAQSRTSSSAARREDGVKLPVGGNDQGYRTRNPGSISCSAWSHQSSFRTHRTSQRSSPGASNLGVACRYHGPYLFTEEEPQQKAAAVHSTKSSHDRPLHRSPTPSQGITQQGETGHEGCRKNREVVTGSQSAYVSSFGAADADGHPEPSSAPAAMHTRATVSAYYDPTAPVMKTGYQPHEDEEGDDDPHHFTGSHHRRSSASGERERRKQLLARISRLRAALEERESFSAVSGSELPPPRSERESIRHDFQPADPEHGYMNMEEDVEDRTVTTKRSAILYSERSSIGMRSNDAHITSGKNGPFSAIFAGTGRGGSGKKSRLVEGQFVPVCFENAMGQPLSHERIHVRNTRAK